MKVCQCHGFGWTICAGKKEPQMLISLPLRLIIKAQRREKEDPSAKAVRRVSAAFLQGFLLRIISGGPSCGAGKGDAPWSKRQVGQIGSQVHFIKNYRRRFTTIKSPSDFISDLRHQTFPDAPSSWRQGWRRQFRNTGVVI